MQKFFQATNFTLNGTQNPVFVAYQNQTINLVFAQEFSTLPELKVNQPKNKRPKSHLNKEDIGL